MLSAQRFQVFHSWVESATVLEAVENDGDDRSAVAIRIRTGQGNSWASLPVVPINHGDPASTWAEVLQALEDAIPPEVGQGVRLEALDQRGRLTRPSGRQRTVKPCDDAGELGESDNGGTTVDRLCGLVEKLAAGNASMMFQLSTLVTQTQQSHGRTLEKVAELQVNIAQAEHDSERLEHKEKLQRELLENGSKLIAIALKHKGKVPASRQLEDKSGDPAADVPEGLGPEQVQAWMERNPDQAEGVVKWAIAEAMERGLT